MIDPAYVQMMARYNTWQNRQLVKALEPTSHSVLTLNRRAFFGSILGTLNHLLWADQLWMSRFDDQVKASNVPASEHTHLTATIGEWSAERFAFDGKITLWAAGLRAIELRSDLRFFSDALSKEVVRPMAPLVVQFFNHQTHHRGQVHAMMTQAGLDAPVSDVALMPEGA